MERSRTTGWVGALLGGVAIGAVQTVLAVALAALVFSGLVGGSIADGVAVFGVGAGVTLALFAWRAGRRGVVGGLDATAAAVLALVATNTALGSFGGPDQAFLTVVLTTMVVTTVVGVVCLLLGVRRRGNLLRFVPYPIVGGFLAGAGWLLVRGGIGVAVGETPSLLPLSGLTPRDELVKWLPALGFGVLMLVVVRVVKHPLAVPAVLVVGVVAFGVGLEVSGSTIDDATNHGWLILGPFDEPHVWEPWPARAATGADPIALLEQTLGILTALFVGVVVLSHRIGESASARRRDLETNRELRDTGIANVVAGLVGGVPGAHAAGLGVLPDRWRASGTVTGLVAAAVPIAGVAVGASVLGLIPRVVAGGVLAYLGLAAIVEWVWDRRRMLSRAEHVVVLVILVVVIARGFLPGVVVGLVLGVVLFAISYSRVESLRGAAFGEIFRSNVDRPPEQRDALRATADRVEILRVRGFVFFGSTNALLERIRARVAAGPLRFLVLDLRRVTGADASAVASLAKVVELAVERRFEIVVAGLTDPVRAQLARGGVAAADGVLAFEPDLDRALQRCEDTLLEEAGTPATAGGPAPGMPQGLDRYLEREPLEEGSVLIRQDDPPDDVFVLESGALRIERRTPEGGRMRVRTIRPGVVVGEIAMYAGAARSADVVAEEPSVVLRLRRSSLERMGAEDPGLAAAVHRWLAGTLAERLTDMQRAVEALAD